MPGKSYYFYRMISPPLLKPGDKIGIVATGRKVSINDVEAAKRIFASWGLEAISTPHLHSNAHAYLAGTDSERASDFQALIDNIEIKAIACARGGYGTTRIIDTLDFSALRKYPKWIIGFSDVTAIHLMLFKLGIKSLHATMPLLFSNRSSSPSVETLRQSLTGESPIISAAANRHNKFGKTTAPVIGGNLSMIVDSIGTSCDPDTSGKILVIEEIDEYMYKVDRMMMHLKRAGKLEDLSGLIVGHMTDIKQPELAFGENIEQIIMSKLVGKNYPVAFNFPIGHENPNLSWVHGSVTTLNVTETGAQLIPIH